jgi:hypothetical protein
MNPLNFTNAVIQVSQPLQGLINATPAKQNKLFDMQVEDTELRLLLADLYQHLGVQPRPNARQDAQSLLMYVNQEQAYNLAQQKFMERQYAYMNGSVLERFRRFIGGQPLPPMNPGMAQQGFMQPHMQPQAMLPPQAQMMYQQQQMPMQGYAPMQPMAPAPQSSQEVEDLKEQVGKLTDIVTQMAQNFQKGAGA